MKLFEEFTMVRIESRLSKLFERLSQYVQMILNDFAIKELTEEQVLDLMEIIEDRHDNKSTVFTSKMSVANWYEMLDSDVSAANAIPDRVVKVYIERRQFKKKTLTLPRRNCNSMAVFVVTVCSVFTN